jgi:hypothetical protein
LNRNGAVRAAAAHANVAAPVEPLISRAQSHSNVAASAAITTSIATTPPYPASANAGMASTARPTGWIE